MKRIVRLVIATLIAIMTICPFQIVNAEESVYTVDVSGYYRSPVDGNIEDSGGESQEALGQSMVESVVETTGVLEELPDGGYVLYVRFNLMDNISDVSFSTVEDGGSTWSSVSYEVTGSTSETKDFYIPIPAKESYVRAECYVEPMGRSVIFYIGYENLVSGNSTGIALYEGKSSSSSVAASSGTEAIGTTEDSNTAESTGLTIGYSNGNTVEATDENAEDTATALGVIDDSVWITLFGVVFTAVFLAGLLLIAVVLLVRKIIRNHDEIRAKNIKKLDRYEKEEAFIDDFETIEMDL